MSSENRMVRTIAGICIIAFGAMTLITNTWQSDIVAWLWIGLLVITAVTFGWLHLREEHVWAMIFSYIAAALGLLLFLIEVNILVGSWVAAYVLLAIGLPFVYGWLRDRKQWGLLVPAYVMAAVALMLVLLEVFDMTGMLVPAYVMFVIGLPFVVGAFTTHNRWLLLPAGVMLFIGAMFVFTSVETAGDILPIVIAIIFIIAGALMLLPERHPEQEAKLRH